MEIFNLNVQTSYRWFSSRENTFPWFPEIRYSNIVKRHIFVGELFERLIKERSWTLYEVFLAPRFETRNSLLLPVHPDQRSLRNCGLDFPFWSNFQENLLSVFFRDCRTQKMHYIVNTELYVVTDFRSASFLILDLGDLSQGFPTELEV